MSSTAKTLLVGGLLAGVALLVIGGAASASSSKSKGVPPPKPGPGATVDRLPAGTAAGLPAIKRTIWPVNADASGQQAGLMMLLQSATDANDWALLFRNDKTGGVGLLTYSQTPIGGLIAQHAAAGA